MKYLLCLFAIVSFNKIHAQVPVIKEPHHKPVLVNDYVRLLDVHINPGDTTLYHIHAAPSVMVHISNSIIGSQITGEQPTQAAEVLAGQTRFAAYNEHTVTHRVFNAGSNVFHVMDIELIKKEPASDSCTALSNVETTINGKLVRVYKFDVSKTSPLNIPAGSCAHLLVCISGEINTGIEHLRAGEYIFFNPNTAINIVDHQTGNSTCVLLELK
ncbi:MAG: hypothetical protein JO072_01295 [Parafilimonas sp.]|nr:hypothetical protein [Parafilimonas sp.]